MAALPKAPSNYHPVRNYVNAIARRNWVLSRMYSNNFISEDEWRASSLKELKTSIDKPNKKYSSDYYSEEVKRKIVDIFGEYELYNGGLSIRTSLDSDLQLLTTTSLQQGLMDYDKRHGYRGPLDNIADDNWHKLVMEKFKKPSIFKLGRIKKVNSK